MILTTTTSASCCAFELEIAIDAPRQRVWDALLKETNAWWLPDFHVAGADSVVALDPRPGGRGLTEDTPAGDCLQWYSVHMFQPSQFRI